MQLSTVNESLWRELNALGVHEQTPPWYGIRRTLGVGPGELDDAYPVYSFYVARAVTSPPEEAGLVVFCVTPGRLMRYEWTPTSASSTTVPLDRLALVEETETDTTFSVTVHVDVPVRFALAQTSLVSNDDGNATQTTNERSESVLYQLSTGAQNAAILAEFSRRLRLLVGV